VETDLDIPTGVASIVDCTEPPKPEHRLAVAGGPPVAAVHGVG
jgi:hypothetical protein